MHTHAYTYIFVFYMHECIIYCSAYAPTKIKNKFVYYIYYIYVLFTVGYAKTKFYWHYAKRTPQ